MFDRAISSVIATAAVAGATLLTVFAAGFALYALIEPSLGPAGAAAFVALAAALGLALYALVLYLRARQREREAAIAQAAALDALPQSLGEIARERPILALAVTALGGVLASRNPALVATLLQTLANLNRRPE